MVCYVMPSLFGYTFSSSFMLYWISSVCINNLYGVHLSWLQIGKTKVFLRAGQMAELDTRRALKLGDAAKIIQRKTRGHIARKHFVAMYQASICLQCICRGSSSTFQLSNLHNNAETTFCLCGHFDNRHWIILAHIVNAYWCPYS